MIGGPNAFAPSLCFAYYSFTWQMLKACMIRLRGVEGQDTRVLCIPFILSGSPNECWLNTCDTCVITTWRLGSRTPIVTHNYYSFKIFLHFWLAKIPQIINHNQLMMTKLIWKNFAIIMWKITSILQHNRKKTGKLTKVKRGWVVFGKEYKMAEHLTHFAWKK